MAAPLPRSQDDPGVHRQLGLDGTLQKIHPGSVCYFGFVLVDGSGEVNAARAQRCLSLPLAGLGMIQHRVEFMMGLTARYQLVS